MRLSARSYPHPVLGNRDDVPGAAFQATLEMSADKQYVYVNVKVACSCETLNALIKENRAAFVLHIECSNTLFRRAYEFQSMDYRISIPADQLNDDVEVNIFVHAICDIPNYHVPEAHPDYGDAVFDIRCRDILAVGEGRVFPIQSKFDSLKKISSIMQISESTKDGDIPMEVAFNGEKIVIYLSKSDFEVYKVLKNYEAVRGHLSTTIVLPVLIEALHILKDESEGIEDSRRWVRTLARRIEGMDTQMDVFQLAQQILELPIKRALASAHRLVEASS